MPTAEETSEPWRRRLQLWRSPAGQPTWARPALLLLAAGAALAYGWQMGQSIEIYYAAAVRSMSASWHDFAFGAFDPAGTISVDKLPGALWVQALSVRLFGLHTWAIALPQVLEGSATVLVLFRAVRRLAGPLAGVIAAAVLACAPAVVTLDRGNIPDSLMILLLVLAADAVVTALVRERWAFMLLAGLFVGLAFQAKMLEAWLVLPGLALAGLVGLAGRLRLRLLAVAAMTAVAGAVSMSWMVFVTLTPPSHRPYVDGSQHDSIFQQVFEYNGLGRVGHPSANKELGRTLGISFLTASSPRPAWDRLLVGSFGRDVGWLLPAALVVVAVVGLLALCRRQRPDLLGCGVVMWGGWLVVLLVVFSLSTTVNTYYFAALVPAIAALLGIDAAVAWERRNLVATRLVVACVVAGSAAYGWWLVPRSGTGVPGWLGLLALVLGLASAAGVLGARAIPGGLRGAGALAAASLLVIPVVASVSVVENGLGAFDTPFQPREVTAFTRGFFGAPLKPLSTLPTIEKVRDGARDLMVTQTSALAAPIIFDTGQEVLPIGGYSGTIPEPSLAALRSMLDAGDFHLVVVAAGSHDRRVAWLSAHCIKVPSPPNAASRFIGPLRTLYCLRPAGRTHAAA